MSLSERIQDAVDAWSDNHTTVGCEHSHAWRSGVLMNECWECRMDFTIAAVRVAVAAEIETEHDSGAGFADLWNQAIKRAASVARGERTPPVRPVDGGNP